MNGILKHIIVVVLATFLSFLLIEFFTPKTECQDCKLKDEQYHKMIRKYNTMINNDSTHKWCIKLQ
jgi:hypothetical protein